MRTRFAPSPTGYLHVGGARTALFCYLLARQRGGAFILRIEDTDRRRHVEQATAKIIEDLRWLGLQWDEGPEVGGPRGPYCQSERLAIYRQQIDRLLAEGKAYYAFDTPEELAALRQQAEAAKRGFRYPRPDPLPTATDSDRARAEGRPVVVRFLMPAEDITVTDDILGAVTLTAGEHDDLVICKSDGWPTYHFACVVDDELMGVTHVLRGQEHLMNTPRHIALQRALGFRTPQYAHLPIILNPDNSKLSKRDKDKALKRGETPPEIDVHDFRAAGYLPEALVNFIALLGWSPGADRERFSLAELVEAFSIERIGKANAKFDRSKLLAFNTMIAAEAPLDRLAEAFDDYLALNDTPTARADAAIRRALLAACKGFRTFADVDAKCRFLFVDDREIVYDDKAVKKVLRKGDGAGLAVLRGIAGELEALSEWSAGAIQTLLEDFCARTGQGLGKVAQPLRVAVSGSTISPPIYDTLAILGKAATLRRVRAAVERFGGE